MLTLPIKKKWFDMIKSGEKKEEYREIKSYYSKRFEDNYYHEITPGNKEPCTRSWGYKKDIVFRNGYRKDSPKIKCECYIDVGYGVPEWGAEPNKLYYVLTILNIEEVNNDKII